MTPQTAEAILNVARGELGYVEGPRSNENKYAAEIAPVAQFQPWCAIFVSWVFQRAGVPLPFIQPQAVPDGGFAYCPYAVIYARRNGQDVPFDAAEPGDIVLFDWERNGSVADHVGIVERNLGDGWFDTIEGNTSPWDRSNGGQVRRVTRHRADIQCIWRPSVALPEIVAPQPTNPILEVDEVKFLYQLVTVEPTPWGFGAAEPDFGVPLAAVAGVVLNGPHPATDGLWVEDDEVKLRAQVRGNSVVVVATHIKRPIAVHVTAIAA